MTKSPAARRLALAMAAAGEKVLLIDSDVRRPTQHKLAGVDREPGLARVYLPTVLLEGAQSTRRVHDRTHGHRVVRRPRDAEPA